MIGPYVHNIDPIFGMLGGFYLWWYGLSYTFGFLGVLSWLRRNRETLTMDLNQVYSLTIFLAVGVLVGGRMIEVYFYEWEYYGEHLWHIPAVWLGGMSTHGILLGSIIGIVLYCKLYRRSFFEIADVLAIAGAYIMGVGRIGNFIDGQIIGSLTDMWWGVEFPDVEGFRHPVVLYDGIKNLLLIPFLLFIRKMKPPRGVIVAHFILWYGFLRIFVDFFREYRTDFWGFPPGQEFNIFMTIAGSFLLFWFYRHKKDTKDTVVATDTTDIPSSMKPDRSLRLKRIIFALLLFFPMIIPSDWTQDVPERYGKRHPGLYHSAIYPKIGEPGQTQPPDNIDTQQSKIQKDTDQTK
jgi:phosphatidylglycerol:prolipoprotein diacylglycerol transferase